MILAFILAAAIASPDAAPAPAPTKICREMKAPLGSHIRSGRKCKTAEQWAEEDSRRPDMPASAQIAPQRNERFGAPVPPPR